MNEHAKALYISIDVEAAGPKLGADSILSIGCCTVVRENLSFEEYCARGLVFYAEIKPIFSSSYKQTAMRVGCSHLECLEELRRTDPRYDPNSDSFQSMLVLQHMQQVCEYGGDVATRLCSWLDGLHGLKKRELVPIVDTVFFDGGHANLLFGMSGLDSPFGHKGLDLASLYRGFARRESARLSEIEVQKIEKPHKADSTSLAFSNVSGGHQLVLRKAFKRPDLFSTDFFASGFF